MTELIIELEALGDDFGFEEEAEPSYLQEPVTMPTVPGGFTQEPKEKEETPLQQVGV